LQCILFSMKKQKLTGLAALGGLVYSTNPDTMARQEPQADNAALAAAHQRLRIWLETKHRGGKAVTIVQGYQGPEAELEALGKQLKNACGTGGSVKDGEILIQGDHRDKVLAWLQKNGYTQSKKTGG